MKKILFPAVLICTAVITLATGRSAHAQISPAEGDVTIECKEPYSVLCFQVGNIVVLGKATIKPVME